MIVKPDVVIVTDLKYGRVPVRLVYDDGRVNSQLMYYAAGVLDAQRWKQSRVILEIYQPRSPGTALQQTELPSQAVREWATNELYEAAHATDAPDAPLTPGVWCRWCPAIDRCPAVREQAGQLATTDFAEVRELQVPDDPATLARVLEMAPVFDAWLKGCEARAHALLSNGTKIEGFKLVAKRSNREWPTDDAKKLADLLNDHLPNSRKLISTAKLLTAPKLVSPAQLEKLLGEEVVNKVAVKPDAGTTVASWDDKREAVTVNDFKELM